MLRYGAGSAGTAEACAPKQDDENIVMLSTPLVQHHNARYFF